MESVDSTLPLPCVEWKISRYVSCSRGAQVLFRSEPLPGPIRSRSWVSSKYSQPKICIGPMNTARPVHGRSFGSRKCNLSQTMGLMGHKLKSSIKLRSAFVRKREFVFGMSRFLTASGSRSPLLVDLQNHISNTRKSLILFDNVIWNCGGVKV